MKQLLLALGRLILAISLPSGSMAQAAGEPEPHHRLALVLGHAYVPQAIDIDGNKGWLVIPSWGIDYDYLISEKWMLGLHGDMLMENFVLEKHFSKAGDIIERSSPVALALMTSYKAGKHWVFMLGAGSEFAREENLMLLRAGLEYNQELLERWEFAASLMNDLKLNSYNSWTLGLGLSKFF